MDDWWLIIPLILIAGLGIGIIMFAKPAPSQSPLLLKAPSVENEETWEWVDYHGRQRRVTVHRKMTENE